MLHWSPDGGGIAVSGARAAVFDFTGANPPHPYRKGSGAMGQPDPVPRVCMAEAPVQAVAWAPLGAGEEDGGVHAAATLATLGSDGGVREASRHVSCGGRALLMLFVYCVCVCVHNVWMVSVPRSAFELSSPHVPSPPLSPHATTPVARVLRPA